MFSWYIQLIFLLRIKDRKLTKSWNLHIAGEKAVFSCAVDVGAAGCTATWLKDNKPLDGKMADKAKITAKENVFTLEVSGVQTGDSGTYSCRVSDQNQVTITCSANLEVHSRKYSIMILLIEIVWLIHTHVSRFFK